MKPRLLIIEDDENLRSQMKWALTQDYEIFLAEDRLSAFESHDWPGNVRELENRVKRAVIMAEGLIVTPEDLELTSPHAKYEGLGLREAREALERDHILQSLSRNKGNISKAAAELNISRPTLYELMEKLGIERN